MIPDGCVVVDSRTVCPFKRETTIPIVDHPESYGYHTEVVHMTPREFMSMAQETTGVAIGEDSVLRHVPLEMYRKHVIEESTAKGYAKQMKKGTKFPMPYIEFRDGKPRDHEGRHRAAAAELLGVKKIPVIYLKRSD